MHGIGTITAQPTIAVPQGALSNGSSGVPFQLTNLSGAASLLAARAVMTTASPALGAQTVSTLLQTQDLSQTPARGGHGGSGHHGGMTTPPSFEAEEAAESQEASMLSQRKKLTKSRKMSETSETPESEEDSRDDGDTQPQEEKN